MKMGSSYPFPGGPVRGPVRARFDTGVSVGLVWIPVITGSSIGRRVRRLRAENLTSKPQIRGEIGQIELGERKLRLDHVQRHVFLGSKPQKTHQIRRSIRKQLGAIFWIFEIFGENTNQAQIVAT